MLRGRAILVAWAAVAMPGIVAVASCVQDLPAGSPPELEAGSDGTTQDAPAPPADHATVEGSPDAPPEEAAPDVSEDVADVESTDADAEADVVDGGVAADSGDGGDASGAGDASDASDAGDAGDAGGTSDASDAGDAGDAAPDANGPPCTLIDPGSECQAGGSCTMSLAGSSTAGDLLTIIFAVGVNVPPGTPPGWTQAILQENATSGGNVGIWYYPNNPGGIASVTMSAGGTNSVRGIMSEWRHATQLDQVASLSNTSSPSLTVSTPGIAANGECAIGAFGQKLSAGRTVMFAAGGGWTNLDNDGTSLTNYHLTGDYLLSPPLGSVSETEAANATGDWVGAIATFK